MTEFHSDPIDNQSNYIPTAREVFHARIHEERDVKAIAAFVHDVMVSKELGFTIIIEDGEEHVLSKELSKHLSFLFPIHCRSSNHLRYSVEVNVFFDVCDLLGLKGFGFESPEHLYFGKLAAEIFNNVVEGIRDRMRNPEVKEQLRRRRENTQRQFNKTCTYVDGLFDHYARLMVVRVDFGYSMEMRETLSLKRMERDLKRFFNNSRSRSCFNHCVGYIWRIEYGHDKCYHVHCAFFFDGTVVRADEHKGREIAKYWDKLITEGAGKSHNCNSHAEKERYLQRDSLGIGMVNHDDNEKRVKLLDAVKYLSKEEQYLPLKFKPKMRTFGTGEASKKASRVGRPRTRQAAAIDLREIKPYQRKGRRGMWIKGVDVPVTY